MIEAWEIRLNKEQKVGVRTMDLCKAFDCLNHELVLRKLKAYGLDYN